MDIDLGQGRCDPVTQWRLCADHKAGGIRGEASVLLKFTKAVNYPLFVKVFMVAITGMNAWYELLFECQSMSIKSKTLVSVDINKLLLSNCTKQF